MLDVIIATPPCQGMSVCNHKKGDEKGRNSLVVAAIKMAALLRPKVFIFENTALFLSTPCALPDGEMPIGAAIQKLLGGEYCILPQRLNLKNYGCPSSRTRTLVIGVDKRCWFSPLSVAPDWTPETTLRKVIGDLPPLANMGEILAADIYHSAKPYPEHMRDWISDLREGQSAFEQSAPTKRPHKMVGGRRIENKNAQGDKYRRQKWDAAPPCVHTRNDIMSSQNTIHPVDNRGVQRSRVDADDVRAAGFQVESRVARGYFLFAAGCAAAFFARQRDEHSAVFGRSRSHKCDSRHCGENQSVLVGNDKAAAA